MLLGNDDAFGSSSGQSPPLEPPEVLEEKCAGLPAKDYHNVYGGKAFLQTQLVCRKVKVQNGNFSCQREIAIKSKVRFEKAASIYFKTNRKF